MLEELDFKDLDSLINALGSLKNEMNLTLIIVINNTTNNAYILNVA